MRAKKSEDKKNKRSLEASGFYSDFEKPDCLYAALVRSPAASGKIKDVTISSLPDGYYLYTHKNIPAAKSIQINKTTTKIFGYDRISYQGEPIGILFGPDEQGVQKLLSQVSVSFDIESLESALHNVINSKKKPTTNSTLNENDRKNNHNDAEVSDFVDLINDMPSLNDVLDKSRIEKAPTVEVASRIVKYGIYEKLSPEEADKKLFSEANENGTSRTISESSWQENFVIPKWQETEGAACYTDGEEIHIYVPSCWTYLTQTTIADVLGIAQNKIFIHKTKAAEIYRTGLSRTSQLAAQVAVASYLSKKPVKLVLSQREQEEYMGPGVITKFKYKTAVEPSGQIFAMRVDIDIDVGISNPFAQEITDRITLAATSYYKPQNLYISTKTHTSKTPPTSVSIRSIDSQAFFAIENEMQKISSQTNVFPDELRLVNSIQNKKQSKISPFPFDIPIADVTDTIKTVIQKSDFNRKYASFQMEAADRVERSNKAFFALPLRGIGVATAYVPSEYNGKSFFYYDSKIEVTLTTDDKLIIHTIKPSSVVQEIWKNTAAEILQIEKNNIIIDSEFDIEELPETPEDSYSSIGVLNELLKKCCIDIQKKRFHQPLPISSKRGVQPSQRKKWNKDTFTGIPFSTTSFITTIVEVELDTYTYNEKIKGVWVCADCGEVFDEAAAKKTLRLEIQQELAMLVKGKSVSCDFIDITFTSSNNKSGQVGGLIHNSLPAAFSSALSLALTTQLTEIPCTEDLLFKLTKKRTKQENQGDRE